MARVLVPGGTVPLLLATFALGISVAFNCGAYDDRAIVFLVMGVLCLVWAFVSAAPRPWWRRAPTDGAMRSDDLRDIPAAALGPLVWILLAVSLFWGANDLALIMYARAPWATGRSAMHWMLVVLATYLPAMAGLYREPRALRLARFALFAFLVLRAGVDVLHSSPHPSIDVWTVQQQGAEALRHGGNPYTQVAAGDTTPGRVGNPTPYVYPPTQVLVGLPAFALLGDVRYAMLFAMIAAGVALRFVIQRASGRGLPAIVEDGAALFIWCTPKVFFILEQSWVDPVQLMFIAIGCALFVYDKRLAGAIVLGIAASSKQTLIFVVPLAGFCLRFTLREWIAMLVASAVPVVPFLAWDFKALKHANFDFLANIPPRPDALTLGNWLNRRFTLDLQGGLAFPITALVAALGCWRQRGPAGFATAMAATYVAFFAFNKQAFTNYYYFVGGLAALAAACAISGRASTGASEAPLPASSSAPA